MTYVILLNRYVGAYGDDQYAVTFQGTFVACKAQARHDGTTFPLLKSDYRPGASTPKSLIGPEGVNDPGQILELN